MSRKHAPEMAQEVRIDMPQVCNGLPKTQQNFVYVNPAYVGSVDSVSSSRRLPEPPTSVIREQYCVCTRWPYGQRVLAAAVGILLGAVIGLSVTVAFSRKDDGIAGIFLYSAPD
ncbi:hypothetical protein O3G_MSEX007914 [Manduca sexta]|uniref:Uncharacterized protein n=1 Tax=Manduca sexta TaxID=7130 RepID=A0A922CP23_MANSE|nr:hypothetical protein O3G_MSEX007914 [Manduca sexta]